MKPKYVIFQKIITTALFLALVASQSSTSWGAEKSKEKVPPISESSGADALQLIKGCVIEICSYPRSVAVLKKQEEMGGLRYSL